MRRTTSLDLRHPLGPDGPVEIAGRGRDLHTDHRGDTQVVDSALVALRVLDGTVDRLHTYPARPTAARLIGRPAVVGWRTGLWRMLRPDVEGGTVLHQVLDDVPGAMIIGGFTRRRAVAAEGRSVPQPGRRVDVCVGWSASSRAVRVLADTGNPPPPVTPPAPSLTEGAEPHDWHTLATLPVWGMSRRRRIDVHRGDGGVDVDAMFRDSFVDGDGVERVLHEYGVQARLDPDELTVTTIIPDPRVLPHVECPVAVSSAQLLVGADSARLRESVSAQLFGPSTCTHLNDLIRSLADVPALLTTCAGMGGSGSGNPADGPGPRDVDG